MTADTNIAAPAPGVLVEVPVMLSVVRIVNGSQARYERRA